MPEWFDPFQIIFLLATCYACYKAGQINGAVSLAVTLIEDGKIKESDLEP